MDAAGWTDLLDDDRLRVARIPLKVPRSNGNGSRLASTYDLMLTVDCEMHLSRQDGDSLRFVRVEMFSRDLSVGSERVLDLERLRGGLKYPHRLARDRIFESKRSFRAVIDDQ